METRSSRKAVSDGSVTGHPGALGQRREVEKQVVREVQGKSAWLRSITFVPSNSDTDVSIPIPQGVKHVEMG